MLLFISAREPETQQVIVEDIAPNTVVVVLYETDFATNMETLSRVISSLASTRDIEHTDIYKAEDLLEPGEELSIEGNRISRISDTVIVEPIYEEEEEAGNEIKRIDLATLIARMTPDRRICVITIAGEPYNLCEALEKRGLEIVDYSIIKKLVVSVVAVFLLVALTFISANIIKSSYSSSLSQLKRELHAVKRSYKEKEKLYAFIKRMPFDFSTLSVLEGLPVIGTKKLIWANGRFQYSGIVYYFSLPEVEKICNMLKKDRYTCKVKFRNTDSRGEQYEVDIR
ncbi:hypothetical protein [Persephonella sp.]